MQRGLTSDSRADADQNERHDVYGQLELEETLDIVKNVSSPHAGLHDRAEVIVSQKNVRSLLSDVRSGDAHSKADISLFKGWRVISSVARYGHSAIQISKSGNEKIFIFRAGSGHDFKRWHEVLEDFGVLDNFYALFLLALAVNWQVLAALLAH